MLRLFKTPLTRRAGCRALMAVGATTTCAAAVSCLPLDSFGGGKASKTSTTSSLWEKGRGGDSRAIQSLLSAMREKDCPTERYQYFCDRLCRLIAEECLASLTQPKDIVTPCGVHKGLDVCDPTSLTVISVVRSGDILTDAIRQVAPGCSVGKILIQRDEETAQPKLFFSKLPPSIAKSKHVILADPMLATGGSAAMAIDILIKAGVKEENIVGVFVVAAPEGIQVLQSRFPKARVLVAAVDSYLNEKKYIVPGLGDFGDRYFGTVN